MSLTIGTVPDRMTHDAEERLWWIDENYKPQACAAHVRHADHRAPAARPAPVDPEKPFDWAAWLPQSKFPVAEGSCASLTEGLELARAAIQKASQPKKAAS